MKHLFLLLSLGFLSFAGCAQGKEVRLTASDNGKVQSFSPKDKGKLISIEVSDNSGSTGYTWNPSNSNEKVAKYVGKSFISPKEAMPGAAGVSVFTYELTGKVGTSNLTFELKPPGREAEKAETKTYKIVVVAPKKK